MSLWLSSRRAHGLRPAHHKFMGEFNVLGTEALNLARKWLAFMYSSI